MFNAKKTLACLMATIALASAFAETHLRIQWVAHRLEIKELVLSGMHPMKRTHCTAKPMENLGITMWEFV